MNLSQLYMLEMMRKRRLAQSTGYRTEDLILHLDGIQNTRAGDHNPSATVWEDLAGNMDITLYNATWGADHAAFTGNPNSYGIGSKWTFTKGITIEVVFLYNAKNSYAAFSGFGRTIGTETGNRNFIFLSATTPNSLRVALSGDPSSQIVAGIGTNKIYYCGATGGLAFVNKDEVSHSASPSIGLTTNDFCIAGSQRYSGNTTMDTTFPLFGNIYAVRVYDANLTAEELYAHWLIDKNRFNIPD